MFYVYILNGDKFYCGYTNDIVNRLQQHKDGKIYTTKRIGEFKLLGFFVFETKLEATQFERKIKKSGHIERYTNNPKFIKI